MSKQQKYVPADYAVSQDSLEFDVFVTALLGGIGYWAHTVHYTEADQEGWHAHIIDIGRDPTVLAEGDWVRVDAETIRTGMKVLAAETDEYRKAHRIHPQSLHARVSYALASVVASGFTQRDSFEALLDADSADLVVQAGLLGEVIYG